MRWLCIRRNNNTIQRIPLHVMSWDWGPGGWWGNNVDGAEHTLSAGKFVGREIGLNLYAGERIRWGWCYTPSKAEVNDCIIGLCVKENILQCGIWMDSDYKYYFKNTDGSNTYIQTGGLNVRTEATYWSTIARDMSGSEKRFYIKAGSGKIDLAFTSMGDISIYD